MARFFVIITLLTCSVLFSSPAIALPAEISGPYVRIKNNNILVNTGLSDTGDIAATINSGVEYGFRVAYRTIYDEASLYSDWTTVKAPDDVYSS